MKKNISTREMWPILCVEPLAIFCIRLEGMSTDENPAYSVYQNLWPYLRGNVCYIEFDFNLGSKDGLASLVKRMNRIFAEFEHGAFVRYENFTP